MIERAACAVRDARALPGTNPVARLSDVDRRVVRAVLQAIREPTHAMCVVGDPSKFAPGDSEAIWEAMIDAALAE